MNVKLILTDEDDNIIAITTFKTDVVDACGDILTTEALLNAVKSQKKITWDHDPQAPIEEWHTRQS